MKEGNEEEMEKVGKNERQKEKEFMVDLEKFRIAKRQSRDIDVSILQTKILIDHGVWID